MSNNSPNQELTYEILVDAIKEFEKKQLDIVIGMTFSPSAWEQLKQKFYQVDFSEQVFIHGIACHVLNKQTEDCIGWYDRDMMDLWIKADESEFITELPNLKSKELT